MSLCRDFKRTARHWNAIGIVVWCAILVVLAQGAALAQSGQEASNPLGSTWQIENEFICLTFCNNQNIFYLD